MSSFYRGSKGRRQARGSKAPSRYTPPRTKDLKFDPMSAQYSSSATGTYSIIKDSVMKRVQRDYKAGADVAESLRRMELIDIDADMPVRERLGEEDLPRELEAVLNISFQEALRKHLDRKEALNEGMKKAFALIFDSYCTTKMQHKIEEHAEYETRIHNNPIGLLEAIQIFMHDNDLNK